MPDTLFEWSEDEASDLCNNLGTHTNKLTLESDRLKLIHDGVTVGDWTWGYLEARARAGGPQMLDFGGPT
jgi:hypothetical protein